MNPTIACSKKCYRCQNVVRMTAEEFRASPDEFTSCAICREKLNVEAGFAGTAINPKNENPSND